MFVKVYFTENDRKTKIFYRFADFDSLSFVDPVILSFYNQLAEAIFSNTGMETAKLSIEKNLNKKETRHRKIQVLLLDSEMMRIQELCQELNCSEATVRNDLRELESKRLVKRTFGGALSTGNTYESPNLSEHLNLHKREKNAIAHYVVHEILEDGQTIFLDIGTTCLILAQHIARSNLKIDVVTNSLHTAMALVNNENINLHLPGGTYNRVRDTFDVSATLNYYRDIHADYFIMTFNGISLEAGFTVPNPNFAAVKEILIQQSRSTIALADHSKVDKLAFRKVCGLSDVAMLVIDDNCSESEREYLERSQLDVRYAPISY